MGSRYNNLYFVTLVFCEFVITDTRIDRTLTQQQFSFKRLLSLCVHSEYIYFVSDCVLPIPVMIYLLIQNAINTTQQKFSSCFLLSICVVLVPAMQYQRTKNVDT